SPLALDDDGDSRGVKGLAPAFRPPDDRGSPRPKSRGLYGRPPVVVNASARGVSIRSVVSQDTLSRSSPRKRGPRVRPWIPAGVHPRESGGGNERSFAARSIVSHLN